MSEYSHSPSSNPQKYIVKRRVSLSERVRTLVYSVASLIAQVFLVAIIVVGVLFQFRDSILTEVVNSDFAREKIGVQLEIKNVKTSLWGPISVSLLGVQSNQLSARALTFSFSTTPLRVLREGFRAEDLQIGVGGLKWSSQDAFAAFQQAVSQPWFRRMLTSSNAPKKQTSAESAQTGAIRINYEGLELDQWALTGWLVAKLVSPDEQERTGTRAGGLSFSTQFSMSQRESIDDESMAASTQEQTKSNSSQAVPIQELHTGQLSGDIDLTRGLLTIQGGDLTVYGIKLAIKGQFDWLNATGSASLVQNEVSLENLKIAPQQYEKVGLDKPPRGRLSTRAELSYSKTNPLVADLEIDAKQIQLEIKKTKLGYLTAVSGGLSGQLKFSGRVQPDRGFSWDAIQELRTLTADLDGTSLEGVGLIPLTGPFAPLELIKPKTVPAQLSIDVSKENSGLRARKVRALLSNMVLELEPSVSSSNMIPLTFRIPTLAGWEKLIPSLASSVAGGSLVGELTGAITLTERSVGEQSTEASAQSTSGRPPSYGLTTWSVQSQGLSFDPVFQILGPLEKRPTESASRITQIRMGYQGSLDLKVENASDPSSNLKSTGSGRLRSLSIISDSGRPTVQLSWPTETAWTFSRGGHPDSVSQFALAARPVPVRTIEPGDIQTTNASVQPSNLPLQPMSTIELHGAWTTNESTLVMLGQSEMKAWLGLFPDLERALEVMGLAASPSAPTSTSVAPTKTDAPSSFWQMTLSSNSKSRLLNVNAAIDASNSNLIANVPPPKGQLPAKASTRMRLDFQMREVRTTTGGPAEGASDHDNREASTDEMHLRQRLSFDYIKATWPESGLEAEARDAEVNGEAVDLGALSLKLITLLHPSIDQALISGKGQLKFLQPQRSPQAYSFSGPLNAGWTLKPLERTSP